MTGAAVILAQTQYVFYGGGMASLREGCRLARDKSRVLIAAPGTCLLPEICDTFSWLADPQTAAFFPQEVWDGGLLQPDRTKIYLEKLCGELGIELLYGVTFLDCVFQDNKKIARFAAKGGIFGVVCERIFLEKEEYEITEPPKAGQKTVNLRILLEMKAVA